ncbi:hypothetical protein NSK_002048 [Nannochloropsis salina CCMP1776]|uniref:Uncharacterized protein n=1 Tax=Nannochloropsis salina CCMP1776 TaxID=1027361 RepID=A0A4D9D5G6_9STRA|nr:hypothetical protein NSK_002048 [Nannochloropsis salina CCMP1776]|eukprot:TFJ86961.1 hypothetical protein NSK_002048 [Nannochloropsis salina CCMP1776]
MSCVSSESLTSSTSTTFRPPSARLPRAVAYIKERRRPFTLLLAPKLRNKSLLSSLFSFLPPTEHPDDPHLQDTTEDRPLFFTFSSIENARFVAAHLVDFGLARTVSLWPSSVETWVAADDGKRSTGRGGPRQEYGLMVMARSGAARLIHLEVGNLVNRGEEDGAPSPSSSLSSSSSPTDHKMGISAFAEQDPSPAFPTFPPSPPRSLPKEETSGLWDWEDVHAFDDEYFEDEEDDPVVVPQEDIMIVNEDDAYEAVLEENVIIEQEGEENEDVAGKTGLRGRMDKEENVEGTVQADEEVLSTEMERKGEGELDWYDEDDVHNSLLGW